MDGSRAVTRCLQQLQRWPRSNLHGNVTSCSRRRITAAAVPCTRSHHSQTTSRSFSTSTQRYQDESPPGPSQPSQAATQDTPLPQRSAPSSAVTNTDTTKDLSSSSPTTTSSPPPRTRPQLQPQPKSLLNETTLNAIDALIAQGRAKATAGLSPKQKTPNRTLYNADLYGRGGTVAQRSAQTSSPSSSGGFTRAAMDGLLQNLDGLSSAPVFNDARAAEMFLRLKPTLGKTIDLDDSRGIGLTRAFQKLEMRINKDGNSVKMDLRAQKFHVRRGQARKLNRRMRWRVVFKEGFLGECAKVRRMIKQGW